MSYAHLTREERYQISALAKEGVSIRQIASNLRRSASTISRELQRNRGQRGYRPKQAHERSVSRSRAARSHARISPQQWRAVDTLLRSGWSPEQISGRCELERSFSISHEWIYLHIYQDKAAGGKLWTFLRGRKRYRKRYASGRERRGQIPGRVGIEQRPGRANKRLELGHWEGDTIHGGRAGAATIVDRKSRYLRMGKLSRRTATATRHALKRRLKSAGLPVKSMTLDNGREFADHEGITADLGAQVYFADPYASWQRGTNENTNGLIRQYLPKGRDLSHLSGPEISKIENRLNHRPRRCLNYRTPHEVMYAERHQLTVALRC